MNKNDHLVSGVGLLSPTASVSARISESAHDHKIHSEYARCVEGVPKLSLCRKPEPNLLFLIIKGETKTGSKVQFVVAKKTDSVLS